MDQERKKSLDQFFDNMSDSKLIESPGVRIYLSWVKRIHNIIEHDANSIIKSLQKENVTQVERKGISIESPHKQEPLENITLALHLLEVFIENELLRVLRRRYHTTVSIHEKSDLSDGFMHELHIVVK